MTNREKISNNYDKLNELHAKRQDPIEVATLYYLMGQAVFMIQILEDALSHSITLKKDMQAPGRFTKVEASKFLEGYRRFTLGKAIKFAKRENIYSPSLIHELETFLPQRNWLIHTCFAEKYEALTSARDKDIFFEEIRKVGVTARGLQRTLEIDLEDFSLKLGIDMSRTYAETYAILKKQQK